MRILAIRGKDLTSLAGPFEVDFEAEPLASAGIFAITGPTGSGKSTLLDAVCLALFNHVPRLGSAPSGQVGVLGGEMLSTGDPRALLRRKASDGYAEVDFIGIDRGRYRARWSVRRARGRADGALQNVVQTLTNLDTGDVLGGTRTDTLTTICDRIGLNVHQFGRAVMLAQGEFNAFIDADSNTRAELLEKLTGTELYARLGVASRRRADALRCNITVIEARIIEQKGLDSIERAAAEERLIFTRVEHEAAKAKLIARERDRAWYARANQLGELVDAAQREKTAAESLKIEAEPRRADLERRRLAYSAVPAWRAACDADLKVAAALSQAAMLATDAGVMRERAIAAGAQFEEMAKGLASVEAEWNRQRPEVEQARAMDCRLAEVEERLSTLAAARMEAASQAASSVSTHAQSVTCRDAASRRRDALVAWIDGHRAREMLSARQDDLEADIADYAELTERVSSLEETRAAVAYRNAAARVTRADLERSADAAKSVLEAAERQAQETAAVAPTSNDIAAVERSRDELLAVEPCLLAYERAASDLEHLTAADKAARAERVRLEASLADSLTRQNGIGTALPTLRVRHEEAMRASARSAAASDDAAGRLRLTLVDGEPCPACGSTDHRVEKLAGMIDGRAVADAARVAELAGEIDSLRKEQAVLADRIDSDSRRQSAVCVSIAETAEAIAAAQIKRHSCSAALEAAVFACGIENGTAQADLRTKVSAQLQKMESQRNRFSSAQAAAQRAARALDEARVAFEGAREADRMAAQALREMEAHEASNGERLAETVAQRDQMATQLDTRLSLHFDWRGDEAPVATLKRLVGEWRTKFEGLVAVNAELPDLTEAVHRNDILRDRDAGKLGEAERAEQATLGERETLATERATKLGGATVESFIEHLEGAVLKASAHREEARSYQDATRANAAAAEARHDQALRTLAADQVDAEARRQTLATELASNGLYEAQVSNVAAEGSEALDVEDRALELLDQAVMVAEAALWARIADRDAHAAVGAPLLKVEELNAAFVDAGEAEAKTGAALVESEMVIRQDDRAQAATATLRASLKEARRAAQPWFQLDVLIGDTTGNKFRRHAQGLTLEQLLLHANARLVELKPRYLLERSPDGEMLVQVVDNDMAGEIRGLPNLSGGERFLVSLALALGLSEMSMGQGLRVESLFIDEGFGALDSASLDQAIGVLEQLHASGRRVGVISHLDDVKERIAAKIVVSPSSDGSSSIEVQDG